MLRVLWLVSMFLLVSEPCVAVREGTATAAVFIEQHTRAGDFGKVALWHETAAACLKSISVPMNEIAHDYYKKQGYAVWVARAEKEAAEIHKQYRYHRAAAERARQQAGTPEAELAAERERIAQFMALWLPRYPNRFYTFGIYPTFFRTQQEATVARADYAAVLRLEADAAEMCAAQYEQIPMRYGLKGYKKFRDAYRYYALYLRRLASRNPKALPVTVGSGKQILSSLEIEKPLTEERAEAIVRAARSDVRIEKVLADQRGIHAFPAFQGFVWIVRFSNHSQGHLAFAIVDEETMVVLAVF